MDNLTHTLTGWCSAGGFESRLPARHAAAGGGGEFADMDAAAGLAGVAAYLHYHRGPWHSLVAMPVLALLVVALVRLLVRKRLSWPSAFMVSLVGVASNPLLDYTNTYGVKLLWPFSSQWMHADFIPILDSWILVLLAAALLVPWFLDLVSSDIGAKKGTGRGTAVFVLCVIALRIRALPVSRARGGDARFAPVSGPGAAPRGCVSNDGQSLPMDRRGRGQGVLPGSLRLERQGSSILPAAPSTINRKRGPRSTRLATLTPSATSWSSRSGPCGASRPFPTLKTASRWKRSTSGSGRPSKRTFTARAIFDGSGHLLSSTLRF